MKLWIAQGFGAGWIPFAPGTFGSVVGLAWFALLLLPGSWAIFIAANLAAVGVSIWLCGEGEKILQKRDPGCIVLDEVIAIPICFIAWMAIIYFRRHEWVGVAYFANHWLEVLGVFALFRLFDIWKPWPVYQSQTLPGGWGVTIDDVLAAVYVNLVIGLFFILGF